MYVGLVSDTHGVWSKEFTDFLKPVDEIWHAGDWGADLDFARSIAALKPVRGVYGNCDGQDLRFEFPEYQFFECEGMSVLMTHIGGWPGHYDSRARRLIEELRPQVFVCGHSHILEVMWDEKYSMLTVNPGAEGIQGWHLVRTALRFRIENGKAKDMEVFELPRSGSHQQ